MKALFKELVSFFEKETAVTPVKPSWETRKRLANAALDKALLKVHTASRASVVAKIDIAARLRKQIEEGYSKHSEAHFETTVNVIRNFDRVGY